MSDDPNPRAVVGHNRPPPFRVEVVEALEKKVRAFADAGGEYLDLKAIEDEETARRCAEFMQQVRALIAELKKEHAADKAPHLAAGRAVDAKYNVDLKSPLDRLLNRLNPLLTKYADRKRQEEEARLAAAREKARQEAEEAARAAEAAAARNDVMGEEEAARRAEEAAKEAARIEKTQAKGQVETLTGGGRKMALRTSRKARIKNRRLLFMWLEKNGYAPRLDEVLERFANEAIRGGARQIDGAEIQEERKIA